MLLGLDSTDSLAGGCTTHVMQEIVSRVRDVDLIGPPRLVRLNPNVPFKTRGNGAVAARFGRGRGQPRVVGVSHGRALLAYADGDPLAPREEASVFHAARDVVEQHRSPDANSGLVAMTDAPGGRFYERCVRHLVAPHELPPLGGAVTAATWGDGRGLVGAYAAAAWPAHTGTFEAIAYRDPSRWGTARRLDQGLGAELDRLFSSTFDNWDPVHEHLRLAPASPCPVLGGVRATDPGEAMAAIQRLGPEAPDAWVLFATNQATGDHLSEPGPSGIEAYQSPQFQAVVAREPESRRGGHVSVGLRRGDVAVTAWAFEPTKALRDHVRSLRPGDAVEVEGGVHGDPSQLALEAVTIDSEAAEIRLAAPLCGGCGVRTKSLGRRGGYRCPSCRRRAEAVAMRPTRSGARGRVTAPISVRRHLSRPNAVRPVPLWAA